MTTTRSAFLGAFFLTLALLLWSFRTADGYTPPQSGTSLTPYAIPALLAAAPVAPPTEACDR